MSSKPKMLPLQGEIVPAPPRWECDSTHADGFHQVYGGYAACIWKMTVLVDGKEAADAFMRQIFGDKTHVMI